MAFIVDSNSESNQGSVAGISAQSGTADALGQSFTGDGKILVSAKFNLEVSSVPASGGISVDIYASTGTHGTDAKPTGDSLATTTTSFDASSLTTTPELITFEFTGSERILLENGVVYCVVISYSGTDTLGVGRSTDTHGGNLSSREYGTSTWTPTSTSDLVFYVNGGIGTDSERGVYSSGGVASERGIYTWCWEDNPTELPTYDGKREKRYSVKIYDKTGATFKGNYDPIGGYEFTKTINGGNGALRVRLPRTFDNYGLGDDVNLLDEIQIWVQDKESSGRKIYSGYVASISSYIGGDKEYVDLDVLGFASRLGFTLDWNGSDISTTRSSMTPGAAIKDIIDDYRLNVSDERINYGTSTVNITGSNITYTSNTKSCTESIERIRQMAGANWYWYVDADNVFYFDDIDTTPTHKFVFGKDISMIETTRDVDSVVNEFIFWNGLDSTDANFLSTRYYNSSSITDYWKRFATLTDSRITVSGTADLLGDAYINAYKEPNVSLVFEVKDSNLGDGYDIESIEPGDTCKILNIEDSSVIGDNMVITSVKYTPEAAIVRVSDLREITGRSLTNLRRQLDSKIYSDRPSNISSSEVT